MNNNLYLLLILILIPIILGWKLVNNAIIWREFCGYNSIFEGVNSLSKCENFVINTFNGSIKNNLPEYYDKPFLNWKEIIPEFKILEDNYQIIKNEYLELIKNINNIPSYSDVDIKQLDLDKTTEKKWQTFVFKYYKNYNKENCDKCPETAKLLKKLPIDLAMFSIMEKGRKLVPHRGPSKSILRIHLGIEIPDKSSIITVNSIKYNWEEGKLILFDDTYEHSVDNPNGRRCVLFMDIQRDHIPYIYKKILNCFGSKYFNNVNKEIEKKSNLNK